MNAIHSTPGKVLSLADLAGGYLAEADVVVVGSGPGGCVAADTLAESGMKVALVEAGPRVEPADMTRDAPHFLAKYYWEGGMRFVLGNSPNPAMMGRCLGGSSVMNSAIMFALPDWVRASWADGDGLHGLLGPGLDRAYERIFKRTRTQVTPEAVLGRRNLLFRDALAAVGIEGKPLPRAIDGCEGSADCITGCHAGHKQSADRAYLPEFLQRGGDVFTCSEVDRVLVERGRAVGVTGRVVDLRDWSTRGRFTIRAPRVVMAAGVAHTPNILMGSGLTGGGLVGRDLIVHLTAGGAGIMPDPVEPWHGATQGFGAFSKDIRGLKYEALWAPPSLIAANWGGIGRPFLEDLPMIRHAAVFALVYKARIHGRVRRTPWGTPQLSVHVPHDEMHTVLRGLKTAVDGFLKIGAKWVQTTCAAVPAQLRTPRDAEALLSSRIRPADCHVTFNHIFGSCRMSADPRRGPVTPEGKLRGIQGVWVADSSLFPDASAVNPQATVMALADQVARRLGDLAL